jgi:hypothetical protein
MLSNKLCTVLNHFGNALNADRSLINEYGFTEMTPRSPFVTNYKNAITLYLSPAVAVITTLVVVCTPSVMVNVNGVNPEAVLS